MILDSDVLIDYVRGSVGCKRWLASLPSAQRNTTVVTHMELIEGCASKDAVQALRRSLAEEFWTVYPLNQSIAETALHLMERFRPAHSLCMADALIAASCLVHREALATWNLKHFRFIPGLDLIMPDYVR